MGQLLTAIGQCKSPAKGERLKDYLNLKLDEVRENAVAALAFRRLLSKCQNPTANRVVAVPI